MQKRNHIRSRKLLNAAAAEACTACGEWGGTVVAAHSNDSRDGKGMGIKSEDIYIAFLCAVCHSNYDKKLEPQAFFDRAMKRTWKRLFEKGVLKIT